ncbi:hypothetical protein LCL95_17895 [Bacillus timonensis]|nr:hypothetical protein [Bacillus timonensis]
MLIIINELPEELEILCRAAIGEREKSEVKAEINELNGGSHGKIYEYQQEYIIKKFTEKAKQGKHFDYIPLRDLQGIEGVPILYAYVEKDFLVMEKAKGVQLSYLDEKGEKLPEIFPQKLYKLLLEMGKKGYFFSDFDALEDFFWDGTTQTITFIDYGVFAKVNKTFDEVERDIKIYYDNIIETLKMYNIL